MQESFLVGLQAGDDLLAAITEAFRQRSIRKAAFTLIGATSRAVVGYYHRVTKEYKTRELDGIYEIVACVGNVSEKGGEVFVHAHIVLADENHVCVGGHLMPGTVIFVGELYGAPVPGPVPVRILNETTGLAMWADSSQGSGR